MFSQLIFNQLFFLNTPRQVYFFFLFPECTGFSQQSAKADQLGLKSTYNGEGGGVKKKH